LCTLRPGRHRHGRNTRYQAAATPYLGGTFTRWNTPASAGALGILSRGASRRFWTVVNFPVNGRRSTRSIGRFSLPEHSGRDDGLTAVRRSRSASPTLPSFLP